MRAAVLPTILLASALLPLLPTVGADAHGACDSKGAPALGVITIRTFYVVGDPVAYIDDRNYVLGNGIWVYLESNQEYVPFPQSLLPHEASLDLQRGGHSEFVAGDDEVCWDDSPNGPDTLVL